MTTDLERRRAVRVLASQLASPVASRIRPGQHATLVDVSATGVLLEGTRRLAPGAVVDVHLEGADRRHVSRARVVRSWVSALTAQTVTYRSGLAFDVSIGWLGCE